MIPITNFLTPSALLLWLGMALLCATAVWLFLLRRKLRTLFFIPLCWAAFVGGIYFREHDGYHSVRFVVSISLFLLLFGGGMLVDAFWSPYADDLADQEWLSRFRE